MYHGWIIWQREKHSEPDFSFLDGEMEVEQTDLNLDFLDETKKKSKRLSRFSRVAAILLVIFVTSSAFIIFMNSEVSYGVKSVIQNVKHFFIPKQEATMDADGLETLTIYEWEELRTGKNFISHLYEPTYLPQGYTFKEAVFRKADSEAMVDYQYEKDQTILLISIQEMNTSGDVYVAGEPYRSPLSGKKMYVEEEKESNECGVSYLDGQNIVTVSGTIDKDEAIKIIESLEEME